MKQLIGELSFVFRGFFTKKTTKCRQSHRTDRNGKDTNWQLQEAKGKAQPGDSTGAQAGGKIGINQHINLPGTGRNDHGTHKP